MTIERIEAVVDAELVGGLFPGCVVAWGTANGAGGVCGRGLAEREPNVRGMQEDSIFDVASVTKVVATATAIGLAMDRGALSLRSRQEITCTSRIPDSGHTD